MLIVQKALTNAFPQHMHTRVDTWLKTWFPDSTSNVIVAASAAAPALFSAHPVLQTTLTIAGIVGVNSALLAWRLRGRQEWTVL